MYKNKNFTTKKTRTVDGVKVITYETEISSTFNTLSTEVGTTGYMGGDARKGGRTFVKIMDIKGSNIEIQKDGNNKGFILRAGGDCELDTIIEAMEYCVSELKKQRAAGRKKTIYSSNDVKPNPSSRSNKNNQKNDIPITDKQLVFIKTLSAKLGYDLIQPDMDISTANELINFLKENNDEPVPKKLSPYIKCIISSNFESED